MAHAQFSPSALKRRMLCVGSMAMEDGLPDTRNDFSDEGTAAHFLAAECLTHGADPAMFAGKEIFVEQDGADWYMAGKVVSEDAKTFTVDDDMVHHVSTYVGNVRRAAEGKELFVEVSLPIDHITGEKDAAGTGDAVIFEMGGDTIEIHDLKYGRGVLVEAERNAQEMLYGHGVLRVFSDFGDFTKVKLVIHQPRKVEEPIEWECSIEELLAFGEKVTSVAKCAFQQLENRHAGVAVSVDYLSPGEEQCRFCKARATCPALADQVQETVGAKFDVIAETPPPIVLQDEPDHNLGVKMRAVGLIEDWCKAVRAEVERRLLAGGEVPGYKLVQGKRGNRAWSDPAEAEAALKGMRLKQDEIYDIKLISPSVAEKLLKDAPKRWEKLKPLITQSEGSPSVAPASDKREAIKPHQVTADAFDDITDGSDLV